MSQNNSIRSRVRARRCAVQAIYQWQMSGADSHQIVGEFVAERELIGVNMEYFRRLTHDIPQYIDILETHLGRVLDRPIQELTPVERAVLLIGAYELVYCTEIPYRVVINEAVELSKMFGADQAFRYINGVLDKLAQGLQSRSAQIG